jgi:hypothetical protein
MIVLVKTKSGNIKKAFIRNHIFQEVDDLGKKIGQLKTEDIKSVFWPQKGGTMGEIETKAWIATAEENDFYGLN